VSLIDPGGGLCSSEQTLFAERLYRALLQYAPRFPLAGQPVQGLSLFGGKFVVRH
jgi:hypothetical protein